MTYKRDEGTVNGKGRMKGNVKKKRRKKTLWERDSMPTWTLTPAYISACLHLPLKGHFASETKPRTSKCLTASKRTIGSYLHPHWLFIRPINKSLLENMPLLNVCSLEYSFSPSKRWNSWHVGVGKGDGHAPPVAVAANLARHQSHVEAESHAQSPPHPTELWDGGQSKLPDDSTVQRDLWTLL